MEQQRPGGLAQPLEDPEWKWNSVSKDFVMDFPPTRRKNNAIWVIIECLTKTTHFIAMRYTWKLDQLACAYLEEIV